MVSYERKSPVAKPGTPWRKRGDNDPCPVSVADLAVMRRIDDLHLDYPFADSRMLRDLLRGEGIATPTTYF